MIDWERWQEIVSSLRKQKLRTSLTAFGVFWGMFLLILLLGFGTGFSNRVEIQYRGIKNFVWMWASSPTQLAYEGLGKGRRITLVQEDIIAIRHRILSIKKE
jgi:putative ABC transport system permease protein